MRKIIDAIKEWFIESFEMTYNGSYSSGGYRMEHPLRAILIMLAIVLLLIKLFS